MLQNKIYQNFFLEISKTFFIVLFGLSVIALTVRAVSFLDLIVDNGYPIITYFQYCLLNLFGIAPKFIPLSFLISLIIFILKHIEDSEFVILWTSGVKKIEVVNLFFLTSIVILIFYLILSTFLTPFALNKSRQLLGQDSLNNFLPTIRSQQFSDSFKGFTFIVKKKFNNEIENIFLHDTGNNLKNLSANTKNVSSITVIARKGVVEERKLFLFDGQIISTKKDDADNEMIKFEQLNIDLDNLVTTTIKKPKIQETSTLKLLNCFFKKNNTLKICGEDGKKEIIPILIRRLILPFYIPVVALISSLLLLKNQKIFYNKVSIFMYGFLVLIFTELIIRYTGLNQLVKYLYVFTPFFLLAYFYFFLNYKFLKETKPS